MNHMYRRVIQFAAGQPWALMPETLATLVDVLRFRSGGERMTPEEIQARVGHKEPHAASERYYDPSTDEVYSPKHDAETGRMLGYFSQSGAAMGKGRPVVAIIGVYGIISQRASGFEEFSGGTSIERLTARFRSALADADVQGITLDVDSPGGGVYGVQELADEIRAARGEKPIVAVANSLTASAAYWLGASADELVVTPSGEVGSIGVYAAHEDLSKLLEAEGVKVTLISAGKYKTEGNPFEPLSPDAQEYMQSRVDDYYKAFKVAVSKGRDVPLSKVEKGFGEGRVLGAKAAVAENMADRVDTFDNTVRRVAGGKVKGKPAKATLPDHEPGDVKPPSPADPRAIAAARLRMLS